MQKPGPFLRRPVLLVLVLQKLVSGNIRHTFSAILNSIGATHADYDCLSQQNRHPDHYLNLQNEAPLAAEEGGGNQSFGGV